MSDYIYSWADGKLNVSGHKLPVLRVIGIDWAKGKDCTVTVVMTIDPKPVQSPVPYTNDAEARARAEFAWQALQAWWNERTSYGVKPSSTLGRIGAPSSWLGDLFRQCIVAIWDSSDDRTTAQDRVFAVAGKDLAIAHQVLRAYQGWTP